MFTVLGVALENHKWIPFFGMYIRTFAHPTPCVGHTGPSDIATAAAAAAAVAAAPAAEGQPSPIPKEQLRQHFVLILFPSMKHKGGDWSNVGGGCQVRSALI